MSKDSEQINEYRHADGDSAGVVAGTEFDSVLAANPDWTLADESQPTPEVTEETDTAPETDEAEVAEDTNEDGPATGINPDDYSREELNAIAADKGVEDPEGYHTKAEVAEAINAATEEQS